MSLTINILLLEDNPYDAKYIQTFLRHSPSVNFSINLVSTKQEFESALKQLNFDVILCDHALGPFNSQEALKMAKSISPYIPFLIVSGAMSEEEATRLVELGADGYLMKDNLKKLATAIIRAIGHTDL